MHAYGRGEVRLDNEEHTGGGAAAFKGDMSPDIVVIHKTITLSKSETCLKISQFDYFFVWISTTTHISGTKLTNPIVAEMDKVDTQELRSALF